MRIVEVEKAPCQHLHASNYDPAQVVKGEPIQVLGNGELWCFDCNQFFKYPPLVLRLSSPSYTLAELTDLANRYADDIDIVDDDLRLTVRLNLSGLLTWLGKKEREGNNVR